MSSDLSRTLSIVIPTWNRANLLRLCLRSVVRHAPIGTEIIVVADGSPGSVASEFSGVRLIRLPRRSGFCAAANAGIAAARGEVVELLNDDTEVTAGWAEPALVCFNDVRVAAVAPLVLNARGAAHEVSRFSPPLTSCAAPTIDSAGDDYDHGGFARKLGHGQPLTPAFLRRCEVFGASGSSAFYRRNLLVAVGGFPKHFNAYFEDVDLAYRLRRAGGIIVYEPSSVVWHRGGSSHGQSGRRLIEQQSCNEERVWWRNLSSRELLRFLPRHIAVLAGKAARRCGEGMLIPWACGRLRAWSEIGACRRHQRQMLSQAAESAERSAAKRSARPTPRFG